MIDPDYDVHKNYFEELGFDTEDEWKEHWRELTDTERLEFLHQLKWESWK